VFDPDVMVFRPRVWKLLRSRKVGILILVVVLNKEEVDVTFLLLRPDIAWKHCILACLQHQHEDVHRHVVLLLIFLDVLGHVGKSEAVDMQRILVCQVVSNTIWMLLKCHGM